MKIRLTESQFDRIQKRLNEGTENSYSRTVQVTFYYHNAKLKGHEIDSIMDTNITMNFTIEMEARKWGVKDIIVGNIQGPSEIELDIDYWPDELEMKSINLPLSKAARGLFFIIDIRRSSIPLAASSSESSGGAWDMALLLIN